jgi:hypothetical protein
MFTGITGKILIAQAVVIVCMATAGWLYFNHSQSVISGLTADKARLETAVQVQEATIAAQQAAAQRQNTESLRLQQNLVDAEARRRELESRLRSRNLEAMARANSADLEQRINRATIQAFRDIETLTRPRDRAAPSNAPGTTNAQSPASTSAAPAQSNTTTGQAAANQSPALEQTGPANGQPPPRPPRQYPATGGSR